MAKKRPDPGQRSFQSLAPAPKIPEGYYSGDKPNLNLRRFVEENATPYGPETDDYKVRAFNRPIETTKATAIYNMHVYWSKKPHTAIRQYIQHYTQGQRPLNRCSSKDFEQVVFVPSTTATFHDETGAVGMLLQE